VVEPVPMAPLRGRRAEVRKQAEKLVEKRDAASGGRATRIDNALSSLLSRLAEEIAGVRVLDPACGSGNFLSVSMQNLLNSSPIHRFCVLWQIGDRA
jgi:2-polyprenyl-3-methyl-5-hydroxy-6-metoxy-1,4-benzoquinol methylase